MWLLVSGGAVLLTILVQAVTSRIHGCITQVSRFVLWATVIGGGLANVLLHTYGLSPETVSGLLVYTLGCELYLFLFTMALGSVSANLLMRLSKKPDTRHGILKDYGGEYMVGSRLDRLVGGSFLKQTADDLELTAKGAKLLRVFDLLSDVFGLTKGGQAKTTSSKG